MAKTIQSLLIISEDSGEPVIEGFKPIKDIIEELASSRIVIYLSYPGGLKLQAAIHRFREAVNYKDEQIDEGEESIDEIVNPEEALTEEEKSLIYSAYLMS